jgi:hypothetical protein
MFSFAICNKFVRSLIVPTLQPLSQKSTLFTVTENLWLLTNKASMTACIRTIHLAEQITHPPDIIFCGGAPARIRKYSESFPLNIVNTRAWAE